MLWGVSTGKLALLESSNFMSNKISQTQHSGKTTFCMEFSLCCPNSHPMLLTVYCCLILENFRLKKKLILKSFVSIDRLTGSTDASGFFFFLFFDTVVWKLFSFLE